MWWSNGTILLICLGSFLISCVHLVTALIKHEKPIGALLWDVAGWALLSGSMLAFTGFWRVDHIPGLLRAVAVAAAAFAGMAALLRGHTFKRR